MDNAELSALIRLYIHAVAVPINAIWLLVAWGWISDYIRDKHRTPLKEEIRSPHFFRRIIFIVTAVAILIPSYVMEEYFRGILGGWYTAATDGARMVRWPGVIVYAAIPFLQLTLVWALRANTLARIRYARQVQITHEKDEQITRLKVLYGSQMEDFKAEAERLNDLNYKLLGMVEAHNHTNATDGNE